MNKAAWSPEYTCMSLAGSSPAPSAKAAKDQ